MGQSELLRLLVRSFAGTATDRTLPLRLCEAYVDTFQAQGGALTVAPVPDERVAVNTPGTYEQLGPLQEVLGEGPVHEALTDDRLVVMRTGPMVDEYPVFSHLAEPVGHDVTIYAVPMRAGASPLGVLSLYVTDEPQARRREDLQFVADAVGTVLLDNAHLLDWSEKNLFHRAIGMVIAQLGVRPDEAAAVIRARAFARSRGLQSTAQDVLERRVAFFPQN